MTKTKHLHSNLIYILHQEPLRNNLITTKMQNQSGQGVSHATGGSKVPETVQQKAPQGLEESLPNKVRPLLLLI